MANLRKRPRKDSAATVSTTAKKGKTTAPRYLCTSCDTDRTSKMFPNYNPSADCDHLINTCTSCLKQWVEAQVDSALFHSKSDDVKVFGVQCPECSAIMRAVNIEIAGNKKTYQKFEKAERHHIAESTPGWRWCLAADCKAGQVHQSTQPKPAASKKATRSKNSKPSQKDDVGAEPDICTCHECGAKACVPCDRPWHEGESCELYQSRTKDRMAEEEASLAQIRKATKPCPFCRKNIEKNGGCNSVHCSQCGSNFCWGCLNVITRGYCQCPGRRPPPQPTPAETRRADL